MIVRNYPDNMNLGRVTFVFVNWASKKPSCRSLILYGILFSKSLVQIKFIIIVIYLIFIGKNRLGELLMKLRTELRNTPTTSSPYTLTTSSSYTPSTPSSYTPTTTTQTKMKRSSSLSRLTIPFSLTTIDDKIIYDVNDSTNFLSNCYRASFKLEGKEWPTVLHYFVAKKFDLKKPHVSKILCMKNCEEVHLYSRNLKFQSVSYYYTSLLVQRFPTFLIRGPPNTSHTRFHGPFLYVCPWIPSLYQLY